MPLLETDPLDVQMDADGDIDLDEDGLHLISGINAVAQLCLIAMRLFKEEWFLNLDKGMPWYQEILGEKYDEALIRRRAAETLLSVEGVKGIASLAMEFENNNVSITWAVQTEFGDTEPDTLALSGGS